MQERRIVSRSTDVEREKALKEIKQTCSECGRLAWETKNREVSAGWFKQKTVCRYVCQCGCSWEYDVANSTQFKEGFFCFMIVVFALIFIGTHISNAIYASQHVFGHTFSEFGIMGVGSIIYLIIGGLCLLLGFAAF